MPPPSGYRGYCEPRFLDEAGFILKDPPHICKRVRLEDGPRDPKQLSLDT